MVGAEKVENEHGVLHRFRKCIDLWIMGKKLSHCISLPTMFLFKN